MSPSLTHGVAVAARAGVATAVVAAIAHLVVPGVAVLATIAAAVSVTAFELSRVRAALDRRLDELSADLGQIEPLLALHGRLATRRPLPAMRGFAIAPDFALLLTELIADERPELVVETGSGVSTLVIAYGLEKLGRGRVVALEHDAGYAAITRAELERHGLSAYATVVHAPLEPIELDGERYRWYARAALADLPAIDMVVDDGPPRYLGDMLRYASLPVLAARMAPRGVFVLDVIAGEERAILARWGQRLPEFHQQRLDTRKGNAILRRAA
ncbi:MAG TPA: class I SAM-dependent methyltransferase [Kofleriaceae bacterium]|nr:class I SAM-dependent methyltransferase [Kofleriaceae bacterium]